ncbi:DUF5777 family beta-barrel protein [Bernardetia sp.]|uniref:DUF5777 family beta-barrel protein n=1 Tax=Bernardetia sp. TaxID=1937974 RepID=UPI0025BA7B94|nr:DUF5777 family beta-barrel protein [Bernardetia sp.]
MIKNFSFLTAFLTICLSCFLLQNSFAQDDLDDLLDEQEEENPTTDYVLGAYKSTRLINLHTTEKVAKGALEFRISHRFGTLDGGAYEFFGLDQATIRLAFEYGISDRIMIGLGRNSFQKTYDGLFKADLLRQSTGAKSMPFSMTYVGTAAINTLKPAVGQERTFASRLAYSNQLILSKKFSEGFSFMLAPSWVHRNLVPTENDANDIFALGLGGRIKLTKRTSFNAEYIYRLPVEDSPLFDSFHNSLSIGFDIETGGHVFQLHLTNSRSMIEKGFIAETSGDWLDGGIHFGFNLTREFVINRKKFN